MLSTSIAAVLASQLASAAITFPDSGAWYTGRYRNLFAERGHSETEVKTFVDKAFNQFFFGDASTQSVYRTVSGDTSMAYIEAIDSKDVRTEGQSYGMVIAVMMDRKDVFDKLWKFAKNKMQFTSGAGRGYFSWQLQVSNFASRANGAAPDGEEYFVTSLFLADKRWGSASGTGNYLNYKEQADSILQYMIPGPARSGQGPMIDTNRAQIRFITDVEYTDCSYHLPAFYRLWGAFAGHHNQIWRRMADTSIAFLPRSWNQTTGLNPKFTDFNGKPMPAGTNSDNDAGRYATDAHRTPMNYAMDWSWFKSDPVVVTQTKKLLDFFYGKGVDKYTQSYDLDGTAQSSYPPGEGQIGANAVAVLASDNDRDYAFVDALWKKPMITGQWRYYNGMIQLMGILHTAGMFKAWGSPGLTRSTGLSTHGSTASFGVFQQGRTLTLEGARGSVRLLDPQGRTQAWSVGSMLEVPNGGLWIVDGGPQGRKTILVP